jgi:hypothetical protein
MNSLPKGLKRIDKVKTFKELMVNEIQNYGHFKLDSDFTESVLNEVILFIKNKDGLKPEELAMELLKVGFSLNSEEEKVIENQIKTAWRNGRIIKNPKTRRLLNRVFLFLGFSVSGLLNIAQLK